MAKFWRTILKSPWGDLQAVSTQDGVLALGFVAQTGTADARMAPWACAPSGDPLSLQDRVSRWFSGEFHALADLPVSPRGTEFQHRVWQSVIAIPAGQTFSYQALAAAVGRKKAVRAVSAAVARNPVALAIPCHRVVGARGQLAGYAWGLARKRGLLRLEGALAPAAQVPLFRAS